MRQTFTFAQEQPFELDCGAELSPVTLAYETYGTLNQNGDNAILICHALTGDAHPSSHPGENDPPGWWEGLLGPGAVLDTDRFFIVCSNVLGGCQGSTGPSSPHPVDGKPYGSRFPSITIFDMVRAQYRLVKSLGIRSLAMVLGGSMGGMQTLAWACLYPEIVRVATIIGAPGQTEPQSIAYNEVMRQAILLDPAYRGGDYYDGPAPNQGLAIARMLGMITYQSNASMNRKFWRRRVDDTPAAQWRSDNLFAVETYLHYQGEKLVRRFDANTYILLTRAMDLFDPGALFSSYNAALEQITARVCVVGIDTDILYPTYQQKELVSRMQAVGVDASYHELSSPWGHDGFLIDLEPLGAIIAPYLPPPEKPARRGHSRRVKSSGK